MDVLFRDRNVDEKKDENKRLGEVVERHKALMPRVKDTQVKSEVSQSITIHQITNTRIIAPR